MPITPEQLLAMQQRLAPKTRMPPAPEDAVDEEIPLHYDIIAWCKQERAPYVHSRTDKRSRTARGCVDFVIGYRGKVYWIECKTKNGKRTPEQLAFALMLEMQGLKAHVCRSFSEFLQIIKNP